MDRSYLSLDGVVNGDIPPSAAVGFGFSLMRARPVIDPEIVKNIGCRAVPIVSRLRQLRHFTVYCLVGLDG